MSWSDKYVGLPYADRGRGPDAFDCWGLCPFVFKRELGIELPSYAEEYVTSTEHAEIAALIEGEQHGRHWQSVDQPRPFDLVLCRYGPLACHVGIWVADSMMLHMAHGQNAKLESLLLPRWSSRVIGFFRHPDLCTEAVS